MVLHCITRRRSQTGNNNAADDMLCQLKEGSKLSVLSGALSYKNAQSTSLVFKNSQAMLSIASGAKLKLHQTLDGSPGVTELQAGSTLARASGKKLLGPVYIGGAVSYETCFG